MAPTSSLFSERRCKTIIGVPEWTAVHVPMNGRISDSGGLIWASVGPAECPAKTNAVMFKTVTLPIRENNLNSIVPLPWALRFNDSGGGCPKRVLDVQRSDLLSTRIAKESWKR